MNSISKNLVIIYICLLFSITAGAQTYYAVSTGNWNDPNTWSNVSCSGTGGAGVPGASNDVVICSGITVTQNVATATCNSLTIEGTLNFAAANTLNITGNLVLNGGTINGTATGVVNVGNSLISNFATSSILGRVTLNVTGTSLINGTLTINNATGVKTFTNDVIVNGTFNVTTTATVNYGGNLICDGNISAQGTHAFTGVGKSISGSGTVSFTTLNVNAGASLTNNHTNLSVTTTLGGTGTFQQGNNGYLNIPGSITVTNFDASALNNTVNYSSAAAQNIRGGNYYHLINSNAGTSTLTGNITVNGDLSITGGTLATSTYQITGNATGSFTMAAGTTLTLGLTTSATVVDFPTNFTNITLNPTSTVIYQVNGNQTISSLPVYGHLTISTGTAAAIKTISGSPLNIIGNLTLTGATLNFTANDAVINLTGNLTGNGTLTFTTGTLNIAGNNTHTGTFNAGTGTVNYNANANQTVRGTTYYNLILSTGGTKTLGGATVVNNDFTLNSGVTFDPSTQNFTVNGFSQISGIFSDASATGTTNLQNVDASGGTFNNAAATGVVNVLGNFSMNSGNVNLGRVAITISGSTVIPNGYTLTISNINGTKSFGDLTINNGGTFLNSANANVTFTGNVVNNGTMTIGTGTYTFSGASKVIQSVSPLTFTTVTCSGSYTNLSEINLTTLNGTGTWIQGTGSILRISGNASVTNFDGGTNVNTVEYNSSAAQTINGGTYWHLINSNAGTSTLGGNITVNGDLTISGGTLATNIYTITGNATGTFTMTAGTTLLLGSTTSATAIPFPTNFVGANINLAPTSTVTYQTNGAQVVSVVPNYGNLTISSGATASTKTLSGTPLNVQGDLNIATTTATLSIADRTVNVFGNITGTGPITMTTGELNIYGNYANTGTFTAGTGTVNYLGTLSPQTIRGTTYYNLNINKGAGNVANMAAATVVNNNLNLISGTLNSSSTLTVSQTFSVSGVFNATSVSARTINNILINPGGNWNVTVASPFTINGNITNNGIFNSGAGTYTLAGASKNINSSTPLTITAIACNGSYTNNTELTVTTLSGTGTFTQANGAILYILGNASVTNFNASVNSNLVEYRGTANQTINGGTYWNLVVSNGAIKTLGNNVTVNNNFTINTGTSFNPNGFNFNVLGYTLIRGTFADANAAGTSTLQNVELENGTFDHATVAGVVNINGNLLLPNGNGTIGRVTITVNGTTSIPNGRTLTINNSNGTKTFRDFIVNNGGTFLNSANSAVTFTGNIQNDGTFTAGTGTYTLSGASKTISGTQPIEFNNLNVTGSYTNNTYVTALSSLAGTGTWIQGNNSTLSLGGTFTITNVNTTANPNTVIYSSSGAQNVRNLTYHNLEISNPGVTTLTANTTVNNNLRISGGTLATSTFQITGSATGQFIMDAGTTLTLGLTTSATVVNFPTNYTAANILLHPTSTVVYQVNANQNISHIPTYGNLTLTTGTSASIKTLTGSPCYIQGNLDISVANVSFPIDNRTVYVGGNVSGAGLLNITTGQLYIGGDNLHTGTFNCGTGTVTYNGANNQIVRSTTYYNLIIDKTGGVANLAGDINVNSDLTINNGSLSANGNRIINLTGNWTNNGNFDASTGTVNLIGTNPKTINGTSATTFYNLNLNNSAGLTLNQSVVVENQLTLTNGRINISNNNLTFSQNALAVGGAPFSATKMIIADGTGEVRKIFTSPGTYLLPIGDNTATADYSPVSITLNSGVFGANPYFAVRTVNSKHPNNANVNNYLKRYWPIRFNDISSINFDINANYADDDVVGDENDIVMGRYVGALPWTKWSDAVPSTNLLSATNQTVTIADYSGITKTNPYVNIDQENPLLCLPGSINLTTTVIADPPVTYAWSPVETLSCSDCPNPVASPTVNTTYTVTITDGNGLTATDDVTITIWGVPSQPASITGPVNACQYIGTGTATYSIAPVQWAQNYVWSFNTPYATIVSGQGTTSIQVQYPTNDFTMGQLSVIATSICGSSPARVLNIYKATPNQPSSISGNRFVCDMLGGPPVTYTTPTVFGASSYNWTVPENATIVSGQGTNSIEVQFGTNFTSGYISVQSVAACGASTFRGYMVTSATETPSAINGPTNACPYIGTGTATYSTPPVSGATSYTWTVPTGVTIISGQGTNSIDVTFSNSFVSNSLIKVVANSACAPSEERSLSIAKNVPTRPSSITGITNVCSYINGPTLTYTCSAVSGASSYNWTVPTGATIVNGQGTTSIEVQFVTGYTSGSISVQAVAACGSSLARTLTLSSCNKSKQIPDDISINVYPNPATEKIFVQFDSPTQSNIKLEILTIDGKLIETYNFSDEQSNTFEVDIQKLSSGLYILKITNFEEIIKYEKISVFK